MSRPYLRPGRGYHFRTAGLVVLGLLSACGDDADQAPAAAPPPTVSVVEVEPQSVTPSAQFVGRVAAIEKVDLRARVQGFLEQRLFAEGQNVKQGDLLYVIEQPPFEAQVAEAQADVAREFTMACARHGTTTMGAYSSSSAAATTTLFRCHRSTASAPV